MIISTSVVAATDTEGQKIRARIDKRGNPGPKSSTVIVIDYPYFLESASEVDAHTYAARRLLGIREAELPMIAVHARGYRFRFDGEQW